LLELIILIEDLAIRPTHINELVPRPPSAAGCCDALLDGAGGVWFSPHFAPTVWHIEWPAPVKARFRTKEVNNSDLEMATIVLQQLVLERLMAVRHKHSWAPAVRWSSKLLAKSESPIAAGLIRAMALRQQHMEAPFPSVVHWPGDANVLADLASRSFATFKDGPYKGVPCTTDIVFLNIFALTFPFSLQHRSWQLASLAPAAHSLVISTLLGHTSKMQQWTSLPADGSGASGKHIVKKMAT
jgi:hypothetical protein